jgi:uncharacterized membrane protein YqjE
MIGLLIVGVAVALAFIGLAILIITHVFDPAKKIKALQTSYFVVFIIAGLLAVVGLLVGLTPEESNIETRSRSPYDEEENNNLKKF